MGMIRRAAALIPLAALGAGCGDVTLVEDRPTTGILDVNLGEIAVVTGDYERVEEVLAEAEATFTLVDGYIHGASEASDLVDYPASMAPVESFLGEGSDVLAYDTLFLNCGIRGAGAIDPETLAPNTALVDASDVRRNLRLFVERGGTLYVSDQSYALVEAAIPEAFDFRGADEAVGGALQGAEARLDGLVVDPELEGEVGGDVEVSLTERWAMVYPDERAWITARAPARISEGAVQVVEDTPLLLDREHGDGRIVFSSFHNSAVVDEVRTRLQIQMLRRMGGGS